MDDSQPGPLADTAYPAMCRATVEALAVPTVQDRALAALAEHEVDRAGHPWHEGNDRRLVAFADDAQCSMASIKAEIFRVGRTGLAHSESIQAEEHRQGGMVTVVPLGGRGRCPTLRGRGPDLRSGGPWDAGRIGPDSR